MFGLFRRISRATRSSGCAFAVVTIVVSTLLFGVNNALVRAVYTTLTEAGGGWLRNRSTMQFALFLGPVVLLFLEWCGLELLLHSLRRGK